VGFTVGTTDDPNADQETYDRLCAGEEPPEAGQPYTVDELNSILGPPVSRSAVPLSGTQAAELRCAEDLDAGSAALDVICESSSEAAAKQMEDTYGGSMRTRGSSSSQLEVVDCRDGASRPAGRDVRADARHGPGVRGVVGQSRANGRRRPHPAWPGRRRGAMGCGVSSQARGRPRPTVADRARRLARAPRRSLTAG